MSRGYETTIKSGSCPAVARVVVKKLLRYRGDPLLVDRPVEGLLSHAPEPPSAWPAAERQLFGAELLVSLSERGDAWRYASDNQVWDAVHDHAVSQGRFADIRELQRVCDLASMLVLARAGLLLQRQDALPNVSAAAVEAAQTAFDAAEREAEAAAVAKREERRADLALVASGPPRVMTADELHELYGDDLPERLAALRFDDFPLGPGADAPTDPEPPSTEG
jgi:hypothetical protein